MPTFSYMARDSVGTATSGEIVAPSQSDAVRLLRGEGKFVIRLKESNEQKKDAAIAVPSITGSRIKLDEVVYFINQLAGMVDTGVSVADALEAV